MPAMVGRIVVVNPNSTERISREMDEGVRDLAVVLGVEVEVVTSRGGPAAVESDEDMAAAVGPMIETALKHPADAYVVACFSDPGIDEMRATFEAPVFGIGESAVLAAMSRGSGVGVVACFDASVERHYRYWDRIGVAEHVVKEVATGRGVLDMQSEEAYEDVLEAGRRLADSGADVVVLGCTGMTLLRTRLQSDLGLPVVEPCRAALTLAASALRDKSSTT